MTAHNQHERYTTENAELLAHDVWEDDEKTLCHVCGSPLEAHHRRCPECGAVVPVCVGACGTCVSPICVGGERR